MSSDYNKHTKDIQQLQNWNIVEHVTDCALQLKNFLRKFKIRSFNAFVGMILIKMNFIAPNHNEHKKDIQWLCWVMI